MRSLKVLFVCTGNLCRSPMAEAIMRDEVRRRGLNVEVKSAGTHASYGGGMTPLAERALRAIGVKPHEHWSKPLEVELLEWADLVLVMTDEHLEEVRRRFAGAVNLSRKLHKLDVWDIEDPYGGDLEEYVTTAERIRGAILNWLRKLSQEGVL